ncbi:uncharacterized protein METZ01_LOCUS438452, partial [marine metagenome]
MLLIYLRGMMNVASISPGEIARTPIKFIYQ